MILTFVREKNFNGERHIYTVFLLSIPKYKASIPFVYVEIYRHFTIEDFSFAQTDSQLYKTRSKFNLIIFF